MTIGLGQAFGLVGVGMLAGMGLLVWMAEKVSRRYGAGNSTESCFTVLFVTAMAFGCLFLLWLVFS
ncbi:MAG TPA: hypothetical protein PKM78_11965 [Anaerolineae bacterium]|nr:hypothetical protein [Anaerolineae bacterium]HNU04715.1 hypothetical protein [Anaerolineae bacterium]